MTGGFDRIVRIWNPYVNNCATSQMKGHSTAITHIVVNSSDNKIISISKDKVCLGTNLIYGLWLLGDQDYLKSCYEKCDEQELP